MPVTTLNKSNKPDTDPLFTHPILNFDREPFVILENEMKEAGFDLQIEQLIKFLIYKGEQQKNPTVKYGGDKMLLNINMINRPNTRPNNKVYNNRGGYSQNNEDSDKNNSNQTYKHPHQNKKYGINHNSTSVSNTNNVPTVLQNSDDRGYDKNDNKGSNGKKFNPVEDRTNRVNKFKKKYGN